MLRAVIGELSLSSVFSEHERSAKSIHVLRSNSVINKSILSDETGDGELQRETELCAEVWLVHLVPSVAHVDSYDWTVKALRPTLLAYRTWSLSKQMTLTQSSWLRAYTLRSLVCLTTFQVFQ